MPLTNAEKQRRYREKLKNNPDKLDEVRKKNLQRIKLKSKKVKDMTEEEKMKKREIWRKQKRIQKEKQKQKKNVESQLNENKTKSKHTTLKFTARLRRQYKKSLSSIQSLDRIINTIRKRNYRQKKQLEQKNQEIEKLQFRNEVLEIVIKKTYETSNSIQKRIIKNTTLNDIQKQKILAGSLGVSRIRNSKKVGRKKCKNSVEIAKFFLRDDISRTTSGKKECRTRCKDKQQIRYLTDTLKNLYKIYKSEGGQLSFGAFFKYKPFFVLSPTLQSRDTCMCIKHSNINYLSKTLISKGLIKRGSSMKDILSRITCDLNSFDCMYGKCTNCVDSAIEFHDIDEKKNEVAMWWWWESGKHTYIKNGKEMQTRRTTKKVKEGTLLELTQIFKREIKLFKKHYFNMKTQQYQYQTCLRQLKAHEVLIICDFSENFNSKLSEEIQSMHFGASKQQITLHCVMVYWKDNCQSFCTVSNSPCHEPGAIWAHILPVIMFIREKTPIVNVIHFYSDGPTSQYRQKKNYFLLNLLINKLNFDYATWSYTESGHGKGVADGIGGAVKRSLDRQVLYGHDIKDAEDAYANINASMKAVKPFLISVQDIENVTKDIPTNLQPIVGNNDIHQIITTKEKNTVLHRVLSCFCGIEPGKCLCCFLKKHCLLREPKHQQNKDYNTDVTALEEFTIDLNSPCTSGGMKNERDAPFEADIFSSETFDPNSIANVNVETMTQCVATSAFDLSNLAIKNITPDYDTDDIALREELINDLNCPSTSGGMKDDKDIQLEAIPLTEIFDPNIIDTDYADSGIKRRNTTNAEIPNKTKVLMATDTPRSRRKKEKSFTSLRNVVTRYFNCHLCRKRNFFIKRKKTTCMVCKNEVCKKCSGDVGFDYICHKCLE